jgi:Zn-dependent peptidase ImmA (M78 family)
VISSLHAPFLPPRPGAHRVERIAARCLVACSEKLGLSDILLPVPVEEWIERPLGIGFGITDLSHLGENVLGAASIEHNEIMVSEKALAHEGRFRFTCAHELGHFVLHQEVAQSFQDGVEVGTNELNQIEWEADRFAAAFLMPAPLVIAELFRICEAKGLDAKRCVPELVQDRIESEWLWKKHFLPALTKRFGVSLSAAIHRFADIRLPDRKPFLLPLHIERLLRPAEPGSALEGVTLVDGFPVRAVLA